LNMMKRGALCKTNNEEGNETATARAIGKNQEGEAELGRLFLSINNNSYVGEKRT